MHHSGRDKPKGTVVKPNTHTAIDLNEVWCSIVSAPAR
ncbi:hypothetical protein GPUN_1314 [Glaciecola punicea ACAM 611]|uniref:Uncharacterized protein n=1 Tax=Glaciecola punicea ACAM 611 TaxID=1121923 RepID=H5TAW1_9ALTE|nr:hypothetical protein GPUN_1314 [Glaciecola punicea ACAM 611]